MLGTKEIMEPFWV